MIAPDILFTHFNQLWLNFFWNKPALPLNNNHQSAEPKNTPNINIFAVK